MDIRKVGKQIREICTDSIVKDHHESRLQAWYRILHDFHDSAIEFIKPFRFGALQWPLWQLLNPVIPSIVQEISSSGYEIGGEIILLIYSLIGLGILFWFSPFPERMSAIENVILEITNVALSCLPVINRYLLPLPEVFLSGCGVVGVGVPVILMILLVVVEMCSDEKPIDETSENLIDWDRIQKKALLLSAQNDFISRRALSLLDQVRLSYACSKADDDDVIQWLTDESLSHLPLKDFLDAMSILRTSPSNAIAACRAIGLELTDPTTATTSAFSSVFPSFHDQLRIARLQLLGVPCLSTLRDYLTTDDRLFYCDRLIYSHGHRFVDEPRAFLRLLTCEFTRTDITKLRGALDDRALARYTVRELMSLISKSIRLDDLLRYFFKGLAEPDLGLSNHDLFRVCASMTRLDQLYEWRRSWGYMKRLFAAFGFGNSEYILLSRLRLESRLWVLVSPELDG
jgi:hypothetical protein